MKLSRSTLKHLIKEIVVEALNVPQYDGVESDDEAALKKLKPLVGELETYVRSGFDPQPHVLDLGRFGHCIRFNRKGKELGMIISPNGFGLSGIVRKVVPFNTVAEMKRYMEDHLK
jgi:hypothetical protein